MIKFALTIFFSLAHLEATISLTNLLDYDKTECLKTLRTTDNKALWDAFLKGQSALFIPYETVWFAKQPCWQKAKRVLEIGSGNGSYLKTLAKEFPDKEYWGIEKREQYVAQANANSNGISFSVGDAEVFDPQWEGKADIVLFRLVLQHLDNPYEALENAAKYLSPNGRIAIIDVCDTAKTSHPMERVDEALARVATVRKGQSRKVTMDILRDKRFNVVYSNLDREERVIDEVIRIEGDEGRRRVVNHALLFFALLERMYGINIDLEEEYRVLQRYLQESSAIYTPGFHFLLLGSHTTPAFG